MGHDFHLHHTAQLSTKEQQTNKHTMDEPCKEFMGGKIQKTQHLDMRLTMHYEPFNFLLLMQTFNGNLISTQKVDVETIHNF